MIVAVTIQLALATCRAAIDAIAADNQRLKEHLLLENKYSVSPTSQVAAALIASLRSEAAAYEAALIAEQRTAAQLEARVADLQEEIAALRGQMGGVTNAMEVSIRAQRRAVLLENRLEQAAGRRGEAAMLAEQLRTQVGGLRRERLLFDQLRRKMERAVLARAGEAAATVARAARLHDERCKADAMCAAVKASAQRDVAAAEAEWQKLTDIIEADRRQRMAERERRLAERDEHMAALLQSEFVGEITAQREGEGPRPEVPTATPPTEQLRVLKDALALVQVATGALVLEIVASSVLFGDLGARIARCMWILALHSLLKMLP